MTIKKRKPQGKVYSTKRSARKAIDRQIGYQKKVKVKGGYRIKKAKAPAYKKDKIKKGLYRTQRSAQIASNMRGGSDGIVRKTKGWKVKSLRKRG